MMLVSEAHQQIGNNHAPTWILPTVTAIRAVNACMINHNALTAQPSPERFLPDLSKVRNGAMALVKNTDAAISSVEAHQYLLNKKALEEKLSTLRQAELAQSVERSQAEHHKQATLLLQAKAELTEQKNLFQNEKESLTCSHKLETGALIARHAHEQRDLKRQLEEERDKSICCVCHDTPRDTIILSCLHFQFCFSCLLRLWEANSNKCPRCKGPIQGLSMSSYLATR